MKYCFNLKYYLPIQETRKYHACRGTKLQYIYTNIYIYIYRNVDFSNHIDCPSLLNKFASAVKSKSNIVVIL